MSFISVVTIEKPGVFVGKTGNRFVVQNKGRKKEYSADKIRQLELKGADNPDTLHCRTS